MFTEGNRSSAFSAMFGSSSFSGIISDDKLRSRSAIDEKDPQSTRLESD